MSTIIYPSPVFGPIHSRRLGSSVGINLMPNNGKICTFDCIYCECGYNRDTHTKKRRPTRQEVFTALEARLSELLEKGETVDVLTFAGNGEPTAHPHFLEIVEDVIMLRNKYFPKAKTCVLSNGSLISWPKVYNALMLVDYNILKLDTANIKYIQATNRPMLHYTVEDQIQSMSRFHGHVIIQTMFMKSIMNGEEVDNSTSAFVTPWIEALKRIKPQEVMVYTIDRDTPDRTLNKVEAKSLDAIVQRLTKLNIKATAAY